MKRAILFAAMAVFALQSGAETCFGAKGTDNAGLRQYRVKSLPLGNVVPSAGFWFDRLETNRLATLEMCWRKCEETPRIANITNAANRAWGTFGGIFYDDSDVFKVMEGTSYILATHPDPELEKKLAWLIGQLAKAQESDGYLYTARTLGDEHVRKYARWEKLEWSHELYNMGHMIEAAVARHTANGNDDFLEIARKSADLICSTFGWEPNRLKSTSGHQEIELALVKLFECTGTQTYLDEAKFFMDMRGRKDLRETWGAASQDHEPATGQKIAIGHAVRAAYLYSAMTDVAAILGDDAYGEAVRRLWNSVAGAQIYLTGGIGARKGFKHPEYGFIYEAFDGPFDLPNDSGEAYLETCAAIANALWNERMFRFTGEAKYMDVFERIVYNGFLSGVSLDGNEFFYPNPLASKGGYKRSPWFKTSCCPVNIVRFLPQIPAFSFASDGNGGIYWNLFMAGEARVDGFGFKVDTAYPWSGKISLSVESCAETERELALKIRIPGWTRGEIMPGGLYFAPGGVPGPVSVKVNGEAVAAEPGADGYLDVRRVWKAGDKVDLDLPLEAQYVRARPEVAADRGRVAVVKGPVVYCAEGCDNASSAYNAVLPEGTSLAPGEIAIGGKTFPSLKAGNGLVLVPYCIWGNREPGGELQTWFRDSP